MYKASVGQTLHQRFAEGSKAEKLRVLAEAFAKSVEDSGPPEDSVSRIMAVLLDRASREYEAGKPSYYARQLWNMTHTIAQEVISRA